MKHRVLSSAALATFTALVVASCSGSSAAPDAAGSRVADASNADATVAQGDAGAPSIVDTNAVFMSECQSFSDICSGANAGPDCGKCQYRVVYRSETCTAENPCDDLLLYWAAFGCETEEQQRFLTGLANASPHLVAACVQPHFPGEPLPSTIGAPERENAVVAKVFARLKVGGDLGVWSGKNVLHGGCSIGATRLPVAVARYGDESNWMGSSKTAACISDGVIDVVHQRDYISGGSGQSCASRLNRIAGSYARSYPNDCGGGACLDFESIMEQAPAPDNFRLKSGLTVGDFAIENWKLVSEGSSFSDPAVRCENDVVSGAPFKALCTALDADSAHRCDFHEIPQGKHCSRYPQEFSNICLSWFRGL